MTPERTAEERAARLRNLAYKRGVFEERARCLAHIAQMQHTDKSGLPVVSRAALVEAIFGGQPVTIGGLPEVKP